MKATCSTNTRAATSQSTPGPFDATDRAIVRATQSGLPLTPRPFDSVGAALGIPGDEVLRRMRDMQERGIIRRIGAVPNHYALGYTANGMTVWDVDDAQVDRLGEIVGRLPFVSHCYRRPRALPLWPYNLFAMVHGRTRAATAELAEQIGAVLDGHCRAHDILYSSRILKKTGLRIGN